MSCHDFLPYAEFNFFSFKIVELRDPLDKYDNPASRRDVVVRCLLRTRCHLLTFPVQYVFAIGAAAALAAAVLSLSVPPTFSESEYIEKLMTGEDAE